MSSYEKLYKNKGDVVMETLLKILAEMISWQVEIGDAFYGQFSWIYKILFWLKIDDQTLEKMDEKLDAGVEKMDQTKVGHKIIQANKRLGEVTSFMERTFWDILLIFFTGGLWIIWMIIRHYRNKKRA